MSLLYFTHRNQQLHHAVVGFNLLFLSLFASALIALNAITVNAQGATPEKTGPAQRPSSDVETKRRINEADNQRLSSTSPGSITGRVTGDDGPLANVPVFFTMRGSAPRFGSNSTTTTGEDGRFRIDNLDHGAYNIYINAPGYISSLDLTTGLTEPPYYRVGDNVSLTLTKGGVITGVVTDTDGNPVVDVSVRAVYVRDAGGRTTGERGILPGFSGMPTQTDDRGIYRIYGLYPGTYIVVVGRGQFSGRPSPFSGNAPTYHPSSTRDTAAEVTVHAGQEVTGVDVRYRGDRGHTVSGTISLPANADSDTSVVGGINVSLKHAASGTTEETTFVRSRSGGERTFSFDGIADGEYEITANQTLRNGERLSSKPQRIVVAGADLTGLKLALAPTAAISGRLVISSGSPCAKPDEERHRTVFPQESIIAVRRDNKGATADLTALRSTSRFDIAPDAQGEFIIRGLDEGRYHLQAIPPGEAWYVQSITLPRAATVVATPPARQGRATRGPATPTGNTKLDAITLRAGERFNGVSVTIASGAASISGLIAPESEGATLQASRLRIYLTPGEPERADDILRFSETSPNADGTFKLSHLAPGRYRIMVRPISENESTTTQARPLFWDQAARTKLLRETETAGQQIDLKPCQRITDFALRHSGR